LAKLSYSERALNHLERLTDFLIDKSPATAAAAGACPALAGIPENSPIDIAKISRIEGRVHPEDQAIRPSPITSQPK
jgi:hypothetical protein